MRLPWDRCSISLFVSMPRGRGTPLLFVSMVNRRCGILCSKRGFITIAINNNGGLGNVDGRFLRTKCVDESAYARLVYVLKRRY